MNCKITKNFNCQKKFDMMKCVKNRNIQTNIIHFIMLYNDECCFKAIYLLLDVCRSANVNRCFVGVKSAILPTEP